MTVGMRVPTPAGSSLMARGETLYSTSYVLLETLALVQNRLGLDAVRLVCEQFVTALSIEWVTPDLHDVGLAAMLAEGRRDLSLVDCVSHEVMRRLGIRHAFAFDEHFQQHGFESFAADTP